MAVICFSSLKGGVGKTTLSLSVASAFAKRDCQTLLIDLDPAEHASRFFLQNQEKSQEEQKSPLAHLFLSLSETALGSGVFDNHSSGIISERPPVDSLIDEAVSLGVPLIKSVRPRFSLLPAGSELRHFLWGKGSRAFKRLFPKLLEELNSSYDYIIIDTPPDYNVLTRNAIASADLAVVPIDPSVMSIDCLERLVAQCSHIQGPVWSIMRTMVNRQASKVQKLSQQRLSEKLSLRSGTSTSDDDDDFSDFDLQNTDDLLRMFDDTSRSSAAPNIGPAANTAQQQDSPIYLLNSVIYRTEEQNRLSFLRKTAFDLKSSAKLAQQYMELARELEQILSYAVEEEPITLPDDFLPNAFEQADRSASDWEPVAKYRSTGF